MSDDMKAIHFKVEQIETMLRVIADKCTETPEMDDAWMLSQAAIDIAETVINTIEGAAK